MKALLIITLFATLATLGITLIKNPILIVSNSHKNSSCPHLKRLVEDKRHCDSISKVLFYTQHKGQNP